MHIDADLLRTERFQAQWVTDGSANNPACLQQRTVRQTDTQMDLRTAHKMPTPAKKIKQASPRAAGLKGGWPSDPVRCLSWKQHR